jgi:hypothetical protein
MRCVPCCALKSRHIVMFSKIDDAAQSYDSTVLPHYSKTGDIPVAVQQAVVDEQGRMLKLSRTPQVSTLFDFSFIGN